MLEIMIFINVDIYGIMMWFSSTKLVLCRFSKMDLLLNKFEDNYSGMQFHFL